MGEINSIFLSFIWTVCLFSWIQNQVSKVLHQFLQYKYLFFIKKNHLWLQSLAFTGYWWNSQTEKKIKLSRQHWVSDSAPSVQLLWWRLAARIIYCIKAQNEEFCCESFWLPYLKPHCKLNQYSYANTPWKWLFYWNHDFVNKTGSKPSFKNISLVRCQLLIRMGHLRQERLKYF